MEIYYRSKGIESFLDVNIGEVNNSREKGYDYKIKMIQENHIPCLIKPVDSEMDGVIWLKYSTNFTYVLEKLFTFVKPDGNLLKIILGQICDLLEVLDKYFLVADELVISPEYMYYDSENKYLNLLYIPGYNKPIKTQLKNFMEFIMRNFDHRDVNGVSLMYDVYELVVKERFSESDLRHCICRHEESVKVFSYQSTLDISKEHFSKVDLEVVEVDKDKISFDKKITWHEPVMIINAIFTLVFLAKFFFFGKHEADIILGIILLVIMIVHAMFYVGENEDDNMDEAMQEFEDKMKSRVPEKKAIDTTYSMTHNSETFCREPVNTTWKLVPLTSGGLDAIELNEDRNKVVVGRGRKESDYRLPTTQISRIHASIQTENGVIFVEDKNSTNGTYVNSNRVPANEQIKINRGDIVSFANIEFFVS